MASTKNLSDLLAQDHISNGDIRYINDTVKDEINLLTLSCSGSLREKLYWLQHNLIDYPNCSTCGNKLTSKNFRTNAAGGKYTLTCSVRCAKRNPIFAESVRKTIREKYDADNFLSSKFAREKIESTNIQRYGKKIPHAWGSDAFKDAMIRKYGVDSLMKLNDYKENFKREIIQANIITGKTDASISACEARRNTKCVNRNAALDLSRDSLEKIELRWHHNTCGKEYAAKIVDGNINVCPHCKIGTSILEMSLRYLVEEIIPDEQILFNVKGIIPNNQELDIFIPSKNIAIEFNGIYWHSTLKDNNKYKHRIKSDECKKLGIRLIHIWEDHFLQKPDIIRSILANALGRSQRLAARSCSVSKIDSPTANKFLQQFHLNGYIRCKTNLGLFHDGDLVAVMSFGKSRFGNHDAWELYRFATKNGLQIMGGASKLFKHFISTYNPEKVISFSDLSLGGGDVYLKIGMNEVSSSPPGYFWANTSSPVRLSRHKTQKHKLASLLGDQFDASLSEEGNMKKLGWFKLWDCGNRKFVYQRTA